MLNNTLSNVRYLGLNNVDFKVSINTIGSAIIVSGVFGFLTKAAFFSGYYSKIFFNVIYTPSDYMNRENLLYKWSLLSNSLLSKSLPFDSKKVIGKIKKFFLEDETDYGFRNVEVVIRVKKIPEKKGMVSVVQVFRADIVFSKEKKFVHIKQKIKVDSDDFKMKSILINDENVGDNHFYEKDGVRYFEYKINDVKKYINGSYGVVKINRTYEFTQNIDKDPMIGGYFSRYIEGMTVLVKVKDMSYTFNRSGIEGTNVPKVVKDGSEYSRYLLASYNTLLLPGEGYTLILTKLDQEET